MNVKMKTWAAVAVAVLVLAGVAAGWENGEDINSPVCSLCECIETVPIDVDCSHSSLTQIPDLSKDVFTLPIDLDLSNNMIHKVNKFASLPQMVKLQIKQNQLSSIEYEAFRDLIHLRVLNLQANNLTKESLPEEVFKGPPNDTHPWPLPLEELDLSYNQLHSLDSHAFKHLPYLKILHLNNNPVRDISRGMATAINELSSLEELDLSQTGIERLPDHFLSDFRHLKVLKLSGNMFTSVPLELRYARGLQELNLNANQITRIAAGDFPENLKTLSILELSAMDALRSVGQRSFSQLAGLRLLKLSNNPNLAVIDIEAFYVLPDNDFLLEELYLEGNRLSTVQEEMLPWLDLKIVDLQNNPWECDCHLEWMAKTLIPHLEANQPQNTLSLMCARPVTAQGMRIVDMLEETHGFECNAPVPYSEHQERYGPLIVGTIVVGTLLLITGTLVFVVIILRRNKEHQLFGERVKYRRAQNEEEDGVANTSNA